MTVWFVCRSHYDYPATKAVIKRFDEPDLLKWFRTYFKPIQDEDEAYAHVQTFLGQQPGGSGYLLTRLAEENVPPPRSYKELLEIFQEHWPVEGEWLGQPHALQGLDNDDELEFAYYIFDDTFARKHPERVAWLIHEDWRLPTEAGKGGFTPVCSTDDVEPAGRWEGSLYPICLAYYDSCHFSDLEGNCAWRLNGVRLPQLARYLAEISVKDPDKTLAGWGPELGGLHKHLLKADRSLDSMEKTFVRDIRKKPGDDMVWNVYGDWLEDQGRPRAGLWLLNKALERVAREPPGEYSGEIKPYRKGNRSQWYVADHIAQLSLHTFTTRQTYLYAHWVFFDDLWASAHPDLANSLLLAEQRWDMLSRPGEWEDES